MKVRLALELTHLRHEGVVLHRTNLFTNFKLPTIQGCQHCECVMSVIATLVHWMLICVCGQWGEPWNIKLPVSKTWIRNLCGRLKKSSKLKINFSVKKVNVLWVIYFKNQKSEIGTWVKTHTKISRLRLFSIMYGNRNGGLLSFFFCNILCAPWLEFLNSYWQPWCVSVTVGRRFKMES
jgi:hypothetical protein